VTSDYLKKVNSMPSLYIVLEKKIPNIDIDVNGNFLSKHSKELEKLAKKSGVPSLISFFSTSPEEITDLMEKGVESLKGTQSTPKMVQRGRQPAHFQCTSGKPRRI
jgi:hypothetical protein